MDGGRSRNSEGERRIKNHEDVLFAWIFVLGITFPLSMLIWMVILIFLSTYIGVFLQVFTDFYTRHILQALLIIVFTIVVCAIIGSVEICRLLISKRHEKGCEEHQRSYFLSFYITLLLLMVLVGFPVGLWILQSFHVLKPNALQIEPRMICVAIILIFFIFTLLKLCLKHPALDILFLIWLLLTLLVISLVLYTQPKQSLINETYAKILAEILILLLIVILILLMLIVKSQLMHFLKEVKKSNPLSDPKCRLANRIFILVILTLILFTIGTIFIADFTRAGEYYAISQNITLCIYNISHYILNVTSDLLNISSHCVPYSNNISLICSLNHTISIKDTLTLIKSEIENRSTFYHIDTFCAQYEQNKRDFITYFSTLIVATITFFVMMYEKFIRRKEDTEKIGDKR